MAVTASVLVQFGGVYGESALIAEFDAIENKDKTSFLPTDIAFFMVYGYPSTLQINDPVPTSGMVTHIGKRTRTKTQRLQFVGAKSIALAYPPKGSVTVVQWYGNVGQNFKVSGMLASISSDAPCLCDVSYQTEGDLWGLRPPVLDLKGGEEYPIVVWITAVE